MKTRTDPSIWISGVNPVREALRAEAAGIQEMIVARTDSRVDELVQLARKRSIPLRTENRNSLTGIVGHAHHQGVALRVREYVYSSLDEFLLVPIHEREPVLILDSIQDPQNLGALMRSACFLGARGIVIPRDRSAQVTSAAIKVAAGATAHLPVMLVTNLVRAIEKLKDAGVWIAGLDVQGARSIYESDLTVPMGLVVGNEQKGIRPLIRKACDMLVQIPAHGPLDSLNAAAAGAIALAEIQRQRIAIGKSSGFRKERFPPE
jgi:23S rRNA (guanosine2251-2'-O)-methyltransferase